MIVKYDGEWTGEQTCDTCKMKNDELIYLSDGTDEIKESENECLLICKNCLLKAIEVIDE